MRHVAILILLLSMNGFAETPHRIVSYSPALTEMLFSLGLGDQIVGTTSFSNHPEQAKKIPLVGSYFQPNFEKTLSLKPTHVLAMKEGDSAILSYLQKSKLNYYIFESRTLAHFSENILKLGEIFFVLAKAQQIEAHWTSYFQKLPQIDKTILIQVDHNPIITAGSDTFLSEALQKCGLKNKISSKGYQKTSLEVLSQSAPDILLVVGQLNSQTSFEDVKSYWSKNPFFKSTKIIQGNADTLSRLGPRFTEELSKTCQEIAKL